MAAEVPGEDPGGLRELAQKVRDRLQDRAGRRGGRQRRRRQGDARRGVHAAPPSTRGVTAPGAARGRRRVIGGGAGGKDILANAGGNDAAKVARGARARSRRGSATLLGRRLTWPAAGPRPRRSISATSGSASRSATPTGGSPCPFGTVHVGRPPGELRAIAELVAEHEATLVVVGQPVSMDGSRGPAGRARARRSPTRSEPRCAVPVVLHDERLSTVEAERALREAGVRRPRPARRDRRRRRAGDPAVGWLDAQRPTRLPGTERGRRYPAPPMDSTAPPPPAPGPGRAARHDRRRRRPSFLVALVAFLLVGAGIAWAASTYYDVPDAARRRRRPSTSWSPRARRAQDVVALLARAGPHPLRRVRRQPPAAGHRRRRRPARGRRTT